MASYLSAFVLAAPMVLAAPYVAAAHPAQEQMQQNIDTVLKIARNTSLSEPQRVKQIQQYADRYLDYERISALALGAISQHSRKQILFRHSKRWWFRCIPIPLWWALPMRRLNCCLK